jgi:hypothetical protein
MNRWLENELCVKRDWDWHPLIINAEDDPSDKSNLRSDFRKARIEVEVQFGNVARYAYDVYKMAISMALGQADVGVQVVCTKKFGEITGSNIAYYERAVRELQRSRLTLIVPLVVIGIEPETWVTDKYLPEASAPNVTAALINAARKKRGAPLAPTETDTGKCPRELTRGTCRRPSIRGWGAKAFHLSEASAARPRGSICPAGHSTNASSTRSAGFPGGTFPSVI